MRKRHTAAKGRTLTDQTLLQSILEHMENIYDINTDRRITNELDQIGKAVEQLRQRLLGATT